MPASDVKKHWSIKASGKTAEIVIYEPIDSFWGTGARRFRDELKALGPVEVIDLRLNSEGGEVFDGLAIYNTLRAHAARKVVHVDGMALSIASVIAMAGDEIRMHSGAFLMIHNPATASYGDAGEHQAAAELLGKVKDQLVAIYAQRTGQTAEKIGQMMDAATWLDAQEAKDLGFATHIDAGPAIAAALDPSRLTALGTVPERVRAALAARAGEDPPPPIPEKPEEPMSATSTTTPATFDELTAALPQADEKFIVAQLKAKATVEQARNAWVEDLQARLKQAADQVTAKDQEIASLKNAGDQTPPKKPGVQALGAGSGKPTGQGDADQAAEFRSLVQAKMAAGLSRRHAMVAAAKENPRGHHAYIKATNSGAKVQSLIDERFELL